MDIDIEAYYEKYFPMVFRRCRFMLGDEEDALDAVQDVFVKLLRAKHKLHGRFPSSLLYTIATNTCLNRIRGKKRRGETLGENIEDLAPAYQDKGYEQAEARLLLEGILETEAESTRTVCFMYFFDGMTLKEVGEALGMSVSGVRKRLLGFAARARNKIGGITW
ncbi:MAG: sigma-70 family RNA polymerase sigma factor [Treponema sp.]|jgi:RNA polymerase sigma-70 factor (ECF subfamily)|nr:sigma-70 family RNA polymerase sigma factor [Treponema sp.]